MKLNYVKSMLQCLASILLIEFILAFLCRWWGRKWRFSAFTWPFGSYWDLQWLSAHKQRSTRQKTYVREGSPARFSCSFSSPGSDVFSLSVGGLKPLVGDLTVGWHKINQSKMLVVTTSLAEVEFTFNGTRALNGYTLQCISKNRFDATKENVSLIMIITIHVEYPPSPSVKNETFNVFLSKQPTSFQLNCSDLLTGNPLPNVTWTNYDTSWKFSVTPTE